MPGAKIPVLEIERLVLTDDGRGLIAYDDGTNFLYASTSPWTGISSQVDGASRKFLPAASSLAWLKVHYISGTTYGATGATGYIPVYRNLNTAVP